MLKHDQSFIKVTNQHAPAGFVFFLTYIGAVVYFFHQSPDFWGFITALIKAIVWPAFLIYNVFQALQV